MIPFPHLRIAVALCAAAALPLAGQTASGAQDQARQQPGAGTAPALPAEPGLYATINTTMGPIVCRLFEQDAPKTVSNFRGLATGTKIWTDPRTGQKKRTPLFNGSTFHRVIKDFMIQGGDPLGDGSGGPGYSFEDEFSSAHTFEQPGVLAMANSGPNTNGSQFFITVAPTPHLNGKHTIFGQVVTGQDVADRISMVPTDPSNDKPVTPVRITRITFRRVGPPSGGTPKQSAKPSA